MVEYRMPTRLQASIKFFGQFTPADLARLSAPVIAAIAVFGTEFTSTGIAAYSLSLVIGVLWYTVRPYGHTVDTHFYHMNRWLAVKRRLQNSVVEEKEDNYLKLDNGTVVAVLNVAPTNLEMKTGDEQGALHSIYRSLFHTATYPVQVYSRQQELSLDDYLDYIQNRDISEDLLQEDYLRYCQDLSQGSLTTTQHYIVLHVAPDKSTWLTDLLPFTETSEDQHQAGELDSRCREIIDTLDTAELSVDRLTGKQLDEFRHRVDPVAVNPGLKHTNQPDKIDGEHQRSLYITEFPSRIPLGWTVQLLQLDAQVDITQEIRPRSAAKTTGKLQRLNERLNAEIDSLLHQGYRGTNKLETRLKDSEWFLNLLADREDQPVEYSCLVTVHSDNPEKCRQDFEKLRNRLQTMQIQYRIPVFRTDQALKTGSPVRIGGLDQTLLMPAGSAATGFPFGTQSIDEKQGVVYGTNTSDGTPVLLDRFQWSSHSMVRMGMVGSGKSYASKIEILRSYLAYPDLQIYVIDPKKEYSRIIKSLDGTVHTLQNDAEISEDWFESQVAGFTVEERGRRENVETLVSIVEELYSQTSQDREKTLIVIDEARILMNNEDGRNVLNQFVLEGRDVNTALTLVTQNASHFTHCREGREILDNTPGKVFMRHDRVPDSVTQYFQLSQRERQELFELKTGTDSSYSEALLKISGKLDTRIRIDSTPQEHAVITTSEGGET